MRVSGQNDLGLPEIPRDRQRDVVLPLAASLHRDFLSLSPILQPAKLGHHYAVLDDPRASRHEQSGVISETAPRSETGGN